MSLLVAALALVAQAGGSPAPPPAQPRFMRMSVGPPPAPATGSSTSAAAAARLGAPDYWFRRSSPPDPGAGGIYTTTRDCPGARAALESLEQLALPALDLPGTGREATTLVLHGRGLQSGGARHPCRRPVRHGAADRQFGSPLARWIDALERALAPCWSGPRRRRLGQSSLISIIGTEGTSPARKVARARLSLSSAKRTGAGAGVDVGSGSAAG